jgi:hypothetical protein
MIDIKSVSSYFLTAIDYATFKTRFETKHEVEEYLWFMFDQISIHQQQVVMLINIHNKTIKECSEIMNISVELVKTLHDQAIRSFHWNCQLDVTSRRFKASKLKNNFELERLRLRLTVEDSLTFNSDNYVNMTHINKSIGVSSTLVKELMISAGITFYLNGVKFMIHKDDVIKIHLEYYDTKIIKLTNELNDLTMKKMKLINRTN